MEEKSSSKNFMVGRAKMREGHSLRAAKQAMAVAAMPIRMDPRT